MTGLVREARARLSAIGENRGRPYTLAVHVMDSPRTSLELGQDVETWVAEGLVDVLVVGMGYMPYVLPLEQWLEMGESYGVPVYPSVNTNTYNPWYKERFQRPEAWHEAIRASSAYYWHQGADGLYIFNLFCQEDTSVGPLPRDFIYAPLREIGEPAMLAGKAKLYSIQPTSAGGFCHHGSEAAPLPIALDSKEHKLPLQMGPDAQDSDARTMLHIWSTGERDGRRVCVRLNHKLLSEPVMDEPWYRVEVPHGVARPGYNELSIWCDCEATQPPNPIIVHQVVAHVTYDR